jgi:hypothetical protein
MPKQVIMGATLQCSFGAAPSSLIVLPVNRVMVNFMPAANIMDYQPMVNIPPFGLCNAPTNPAVIAATTAAAGVFTPAPCIPVTTAPWIPGSPTVPIANMPALNDISICLCTWLGVISITNPGQMTEDIP